MSVVVEDMWNYNLVDNDVPMPSSELLITADPCNYDPELEPVPAIITSEQQASSSRVTLDNQLLAPTTPDSCFLRLHPCPLEEPMAAALPSFMDKEVLWAIEGEVNEARVESSLLFMSAVFNQGEHLGPVLLKWEG
ncbi:hypothetical protein K438DRAFT_1778004 [Mycena galopus ATCC 62051]|nr:hypothetical protein K438DRAFT_1778004 [Mycena galopus ATCC 62051]